MSSPGVNVLRYTALFAGVLYGIYHQSALKSQQRLNEVDRKYRKEESLIAKAKAEYVKKTMPREKLTSGGDGESFTRFNIFRAPQNYEWEECFLGYSCCHYCLLENG